MKKKRLLILYLLLGICTWGHALNPITSHSRQHPAQTSTQKLSATVQDGKIILNIPESAIGKELLITAQANEGFGLRNRPLSSIGGVRLQKSADGNKIFFNKERFEERITTGNSELRPAFEASNRQPLGIDYPVINNIDKDGFYAIDITKAILNGENWYQLQMKDLFPSSRGQAVADTIITFDEGIYVAFKQEYRIQSELNPTVEMQIGCAVRLLDAEPLGLRYANHHFPYTYLTFKDYGRSPYVAVEDSIICRWRIHPRKPLICCIDPLCPPTWASYIKKGVLAWNKAFEQAGIKNAIKIHENAQDEIPALHRFVISYDLGAATTTRQQITHPETGEILYTRLNLGHGLLLPYLNNYWWEYGSEDKRIRKNILHEQVAGEILQTIIMREFGLALGLTAPSPENYWEDSALQELNNGKNSNFPTQQDCKQIAWGYQQTSAYKDAIKERKLLEKIILPTRPTSTEEKIQKEKILTRKLKNYETMFSFLKSEIALHGTNQQYIVLYNQGIQSLTNHLKKLAGIISTENAERILALLDYYVFQEEHQWLDIPSLHIGNRTSYSKIISNIGKEVFKSLFQQQSIDAFTQQNPTLWNRLHDKIWNQFDTGHKPSVYQMEMQAFYVDTLTSIVRNTSNQNSYNYIITVAQELQYLKRQLKILQKEHPEQEGRIHYELLLERIK